MPIASPTTSRRLTELAWEACQSMLPLVSMIAIGSRGTPGFRTGLRSLMLGSSMRSLPFWLHRVLTAELSVDCRGQDHGFEPFHAHPGPARLFTEIEKPHVYPPCVGATPPTADKHASLQHVVAPVRTPRAGGPAARVVDPAPAGAVRFSLPAAGLQIRPLARPGARRSWGLAFQAGTVPGPSR